MATAYPLFDRSGVDDDDAPLPSVQLPRAAPDSVSRPAPDVPPRPSRWRAALMLASLAAANVTLLGALAAVGSRYPAFASPGVLAFSFGLRHAVDADHLAAIDCVSRKLIADRRPSLGVGLYFSLGHSTVVLLLCVGVAAGSAELKHRGGLERVGAVVGAAVSAGVLLLVGAVNVAIARGLFREWRALRSGGLVEEVHGDHDGGAGTHTHLVAVDADARIVAGPGFLARCCPRAFDVVDRAWKMYYVGFLFGLGFDTASEVALLALTALSAKDGLPPETASSDRSVFPREFRPRA
ncbi:high-affinity nickel-transport protein [Aureococcus anophagefferens]|nr:high-affinity nickel-transport protein [Aureococcus anophagefferens]